jgi:hypothetical protein
MALKIKVIIKNKLIKITVKFKDILAHGGNADYKLVCKKCNIMLQIIT